MAISRTRPNSLFASLAVTDEGSSLSPRLFRNVATRSDPERCCRTRDEVAVSVLAIWRFIYLFWAIWTKQSIRLKTAVDTLHRRNDGPLDHVVRFGVVGVDLCGGSPRRAPHEHVAMSPLAPATSVLARLAET